MAKSCKTYAMYLRKPRGQKRAGSHSQIGHYNGLPRGMRERGCAGWAGTCVPWSPSSANFFCHCWLSSFQSLQSRSPSSAHISCDHLKQVQPEGHVRTATLTGWFLPWHNCTPAVSAGFHHVHREWLAFWHPFLQGIYLASFGNDWIRALGQMLDSVMLHTTFHDFRDSCVTIIDRIWV